MEAKDIVKVNAAIISVHDKTGVAYFVSELLKINPEIRIISSGGTFRELEHVAGSNLIDVSSYTGFPEMPGGLVKTLHPKVHGGLLGNDEQDDFMKKHGIERIDLVVVNLYPFSEAASAQGSTTEHARKNIDIGGVSLIEAGCKNFLRVAVVTEPFYYGLLIDVLKQNSGCTLFETRIELAKLGLMHISRYLNGISSYFQKLSADDVKNEYLK